MLRILKYILCVLVVLLAFTAIGVGDVGNFNDYDSGGSWSSPSSDRGSSGGRSSSSSDDSSWGRSSSSSDDSSWGWSKDSSDSGWRSSRSSRNEISDDSTSRKPVEPPSSLDKFLFLLAAIFMCLTIYAVFTHEWGSTSQPKLKWGYIPDNSFEITQALTEQDPAFNAVAFLEWAKEVFFKLQYAWMDRDWEQVRPFESEELYATHERQLQEYKRLGRINIIERINVNNAYFFQLIKDQEWETLWVMMNVRMIDYIVDEHTRNVLKGTPDKDCFMSYFYVFKRKAGVKTMSAKQGVDTITCPNCGAPTHVVSSGKCEYCNFVITVKDHGWVLTDIVGIKPPYDYGAGGVIIQDKPEE